MRILFVCSANSCRSQMAEAMARHLGRGQVEAASAGTLPGVIDPLTLKTLEEARVDVSGLRPKSLVEVTAAKYDWVVTLCAEAEAACPAVGGRRGRLHWPIEDPARAAGGEEARRAAFRSARDAIRSRLEAWLPTLNTRE